MMRKTFGEPGVVVEPTLYFAGTDATHEVRVYRSGALFNLVPHATFGADQTLEQVHELSARIERALRAELEAVGTVLVHAEPPQAA